MHSGSRYRSHSPTVPSMNRLRLHDGRHRSPYRSPSPHRSKKYSHGNDKYSKHHHSRDRRKEDRHSRRYSSSPEDDFVSYRHEGSKQERISASGLSSPSPSQKYAGNYNVPERRIISKPKTDENVLQKMERSFSDGPLEALKRSVHEGIKIMVWIRNQNGIRGICTGYVLAFDKFWNLVLRDVDEAYQKNQRPKCPYLNSDIKNDEIPEAVRVLKTEVDKPSEKKSKDKEGEKVADKKSDEITVENPHQVIDLESGEMMNTETEDAEAIAEREAEIAEKRAKRALERQRQKLLKKMCSVSKRHIAKLFIRGDNVVFIRICD